MTDDDQRVRTLGERLDEAGRRLSVRHLPAYPWAGGLGRVLARARSLTGQFDGRFERVEWPPDGRDLTASATRWAARRGAAGTAPGPAGVPGLPVAADGARAGEGRPLPADVRARLRARVGPGADALRVHDDGAADALARAHRADAVTVGRDVYFRGGRYRPRQDGGFALLAHEATHVLALLHPAVAWRRATDGGVADEERRALAAERAVRGGLDPRAGPGDGRRAAPAGAGRPPHGGPGGPRRGGAVVAGPAGPARPAAQPDRRPDAPAARQGPDRQHDHGRRLLGDVQPGGAHPRAGQHLRRGRHPRARRAADAVRAWQGPGADDGAVLRHLRGRRGRPQPHRADRAAARQAAADQGPPGPAVLHGPAAVPLRAGGRRPALHDVPPRRHAGPLDPLGAPAGVRRGRPRDPAGPVLRLADRLGRGERRGRDGAAGPLGRRDGPRHLAGRHLERLGSRLPGRRRALARDRRRQHRRGPLRPAAREGLGDPRTWLAPGGGTGRAARAGGGATVTESTYAPSFEVRISGVTLAADLTDQILSLVVETDLDLAGSFGIVVRNADNALLDSALLDLGKTVEIHLGYGNHLRPAILGEIAAIEPSFPQDGPPTIRVSGYDKSYKMRRAQPEPTEYVRMNDSAIAARIAVENGLIPVVDPTPSLPEKVTQVESDMAFLKSRAQRYFFDVYVEWDRLHFQFPRPQTAAHVLEWGKNLSSSTPRCWPGPCWRTCWRACTRGPGRASGFPTWSPATMSPSRASGGASAAPTGCAR